MDSNTALRLLRSGAITDQQYEELIARIPAAPHEGRNTQPQQAEISNHGFMKTATAAGGGAIMGSLAADLVRSAISDPMPEVLEATVETTTVWTDDGYITQGEITWEGGDGEILAEGSYSEAGTWDDPAPLQATDEIVYEQVEANPDLVGFDFL